MDFPGPALGIPVSAQCQHGKNRKRRQKKLSLHQLRKTLDTLAQKSLQSPPPRNYTKKIMMGIWRVIGSTRLHNLATRSILVGIDVGKILSEALYTKKERLNIPRLAACIKEASSVLKSRAPPHRPEGRESMHNNH
eukprot:1146372-Pelagomonas_calceolata.AAC.8